jgi:hypothetical protein
MQRVDVSVKLDIMSGEWGSGTPGMGDADNSTHPCIEHRKVPGDTATIESKILREPLRVVMGDG